MFYAAQVFKIKGRTSLFGCAACCYLLEHGVKVHVFLLAQPWPALWAQGFSGKRRVWLRPWSVRSKALWHHSHWLWKILYTLAATHTKTRWTSENKLLKCERVPLGLPLQPVERSKMLLESSSSDLFQTRWVTPWKNLFFPVDHPGSPGWPAQTCAWLWDNSSSTCLFLWGCASLLLTSLQEQIHPPCHQTSHSRVWLITILITERAAARVRLVLQYS